MKLDKETLAKIAHLGRLDFQEESQKDMIQSMNEIITWVEQLGEVNTEGILPVTNMTKEVNVMREDEVKPHLEHERGLKNAPQKDSDYIRVPKVLE